MSHNRVLRNLKLLVDVFNDLDKELSAGLNCDELALMDKLEYIITEYDKIK